jgi:anti-sigma B factor antagonist
MTPQLSRSVTDVGGTRVVSLHGELDIATGDGLLDWLLENAGSTLVIDLDGVSFMDSSGIRVIVQAKNRLGDSLVLARPRRNVRLVFEVTGLDNWFSDWDPAWSTVPAPPGPSSDQK